MKNAVLLISLMMFSLTVHATQSMLDAFLFTYPETRDTKLHACTTCHKSIRGGLLNTYGEELKKHKLNFKTIEDLDSDKDDISNKDEIIHSSFPGTNEEQTEYFVFNKNGTKGEVRFNHNAHQFAEAYISKGECTTCHRNNEFSRYMTDRESSSHQPLGRHTTCYGCHMQAQRDGNSNAPKKCNGCHQSTVWD